MSQSASVIESVNVEEESDEEDQEARDQCQTEEARSRQRETEEQIQVEDQVEDRTFHHQHGDGCQGTGGNANQEVREPHSTRRQRSTETDGVNESKIERTLQQYECECKSVLAWLRERVKIN